MGMRETWEGKRHRNGRNIRMGDTWCDLFKMWNLSFKYSITVEQTEKNGGLCLVFLKQLFIF